MKFSYLLVIATVFALSGMGTARAAEQNVMGFQAWKSSRIDEARNVLDRIELEIQLDKAPAVERGIGDKAGAQASAASKEAPKAAPRGMTVVAREAHKTGRPDQRLEQARLNVEIAQELSVHDYFVLYLNQFKGREPYLEAAKKLTPEETAELMLAFRKELSGNEADESVPSSLTGAPKAKVP